MTKLAKLKSDETEKNSNNIISITEVKVPENI